MSDKGLGGATLGVTQTIALWTVLIPPVSEVRRTTPGEDPDFADDVRNSEAIVIAVSLVVASIMSKLEGSLMPLVATAFLLFTLVAAYEYTLRKP